MFGLFRKKRQLDEAEAVLTEEFGFRLDRCPAKESVVQLFDAISQENNLSHEARVALLYRLVVMNFLAACKVLQEEGEGIDPSDLIWLTEFSDSSVDWSERAADHLVFEQATSELNFSIRAFYEYFGLRQGK